MFKYKIINIIEKILWLFYNLKIILIIFYNFTDKIFNFILNKYSICRLVFIMNILFVKILRNIPYPPKASGIPHTIKFRPSPLHDSSYYASTTAKKPVYLPNFSSCHVLRRKNLRHVFDPSCSTLSPNRWRAADNTCLDHVAYSYLLNCNHSY